MTTSSRNPMVRNLIEQDGDEATKEYVRNYYNIPSNITDWPTLDDMAEAKQKQMNMEFKNQQ